MWTARGTLKVGQALPAVFDQLRLCRRRCECDRRRPPPRRISHQPRRRPPRRSRPDDRAATSSTSSGEMFSPPRRISSLIRPVRRRYPEAVEHTLIPSAEPAVEERRVVRVRRCRDSRALRQGHEYRPPLRLRSGGMRPVRQRSRCPCPVAMPDRSDEPLSWRKRVGRHLVACLRHAVRLEHRNAIGALSHRSKSSRAQRRAARACEAQRRRAPRRPRRTVEQHVMERRTLRRATSRRCSASCAQKRRGDRRACSRRTEPPETSGASVDAIETVDVEERHDAERNIR